MSVARVDGVDREVIVKAATEVIVRAASEEVIVRVASEEVIVRAATDVVMLVVRARRVVLLENSPLLSAEGSAEAAVLLLLQVRMAD